MILQSLLVTCGFVLMYAITLRFLWRQKRKELIKIHGPDPIHKDLTLYKLPATPQEKSPAAAPEQSDSAKASQPPKADESENQSEESKLLRQWDFHKVGVIGETLQEPDWLLLPFSSLYSRLWRNPVFAVCMQSPDDTTLALVGVMDTPLVLLSSFGPDHYLITYVGEAELVSNESCVKQCAPNAAKAWRRHSATVAMWERDGQTASRDYRNIWRIAAAGLDNVIWSKQFDQYDREAYLQKAVLIFSGAVISLLMGIGLAIWL